MQNPAAIVSQDQEYVQHLKTNGRHREEVDRYHSLQVILQECAPALRRRLAASHHVLADTPLEQTPLYLTSGLFGHKLKSEFGSLLT
jgi:hypothetical protein